MKKILCLLLALAMVLTLVACNDDSGPSTNNDDNEGRRSRTTAEETDDETTTATEDESTTSAPESKEEPTTSSSLSGPLADTKLMKSFASMASDEFAVELEFEGINMVMYRKGNDIYLEMDIDSFGAALGEEMPNTKIYVVDMVMYILNDADKTGYSMKIDQAMLDEMLTEFSALDGAVEGIFDAVDEAELTDTGTDIFNGKSVSYEEITASDGSIIRAYFDGDTLLAVESDDELIEISLSPKVPAGAFKIPSDYDIMDLSASM
ncbi:MAG: hypothetical protein FWG83_03950 [Oscillospiraceae bacterium]|nr:hypothetical protein [Oscillospiraceae bacterium]